MTLGRRIHGAISRHLTSSHGGTSPLLHSIARQRPILASRGAMQQGANGTTPKPRPFTTYRPLRGDTKQSSNESQSRNRSYDGEPSLRYKMLESAATSFASVLVLAIGFASAAYAYHKFYKKIQLTKMANAFAPGDPVLVLAAKGKGISHSTIHHEGDDEHHWVERPEQAKVDDIVSGHDYGHYHLLIGEKGTGKSSMLIEAMRKVDGDGVAMFEAHSDLEIFRIRLGKALDYEFHEDYIGGYFSERGPRDTTALLDIERALNKLEKVALQRRAEIGRPLVLIINQMHLIRDDEDGKDLFELLQQRAEQWAASNLVTMVFNSDDYWVYEQLKQLATRMEVLSVQDLPKTAATAALKRYRARYFQERISDDMATQVYDRVGGRLTFLNRVAKSTNMLETCKHIMEVEKTYFLNQCWILGAEMDDDVMDQQKWAVRQGSDGDKHDGLLRSRTDTYRDFKVSAAAMVLALALVDQERDLDDIQTYDPVFGHKLVSFPMHKAQEIQTRADFVRQLDRMNLFTITSNAQMRAASVPMQHAFREICAEPGFRDHLQKTIDRIAAIESLGRTRELVAKDLVLGGKYEIAKEGSGKDSRVVVTLQQPPEEDDDNGV
ncbi:hypothetical protein VM1G_07572 [Cytospora mali]|uniref:Orc1-like AAA ATPase domain-containing protein n=1 Tax=Cytospora mali TaxID=578113 RepID=A0A194W7I1_CYTMA|nr:hypothetical protein VM1G_07572 [Valsa mali]